MGVILILILGSLAVATTFLVAFIWAVRTGQFDDVSTPALRPLTDEPPAPNPPSPPSTRVKAKP